MTVQIEDITNDKSRDEVSAFIKYMTGTDPHLESLKLMAQGGSIVVMSKREDGRIVGVRGYSKVPNPFQGLTLGLALLLDLGNGHEKELVPE
jgi:hypothetical protein